MRKIFVLFMVFVLLFCLCSCTEGSLPNNGQEGTSPGDNDGTQTGNESPSGNDGNSGDTNNSDGAQADKILVAYFSCTGTTKKVAELVSATLKADIYEIVPKVPYTEADLKYYTDCRADREQADSSARPEIDGGVKDVGQYATVFIGYPIWHGQAPKIIYTFLESCDLSGKIIVPFCTSQSSGIGSSDANLHTLQPKGDWKSGKRFSSSTTQEDVDKWLETLEIKSEKEAVTVKISCNNKVLEMKLADNPSAQAFLAKLQNGSVTVTMNDYGDFEKVGELGFSLPQTNRQITTSPGDVILYLGSNITIYYDTNSWNFTLLGKIENMTRETMLEFFGGKGQVEVTFSL